jgi:hypothetical protein
MGLFRKRTVSPEQLRADQDGAIAAFWAWWTADGEARAARQFDGEGSSAELEAVTEELARRVDAIGALAFETGAGVTARHVLVVTAAGDPEMRPLADRWLAAAPAPTEAFEYAAWRQPVAEPAGLAIGYDGHEVALADAAVRTSVEGSKVHVEVAHAAFASMPREAQGQVTFLFLDALLGEQVVEESIGEVSWTSTPAEGGVPLVELRELVARVREG